MSKGLENKVKEFKAWYTSKTIIGLIISSVSGVVYALTDGNVDISGATNEVLDGAETIAVEADKLWAGVLFFVGQALAVWGRLKAKVGLK